MDGLETDMKSYSSREIIQIIQADGWVLVRVEGSHHIFKHSEKKGIVTIPHPKKDLPQKTVRSIFMQAGTSID
jgi:predicted RNA binding protein YcfA (HicA-like mRNA interferase family)